MKVEFEMRDSRYERPAKSCQVLVFHAFVVLALVSAWNVNELPDAEFRAWFEAWEAESDRLFARAGYDAENLGTEILYHAGEIRKRLGMGGLE